MNHELLQKIRDDVRYMSDEIGTAWPSVTADGVATFHRGDFIITCSGARAERAAVAIARSFGSLEVILQHVEGLAKELAQCKALLAQNGNNEGR